MWRGVRLVGVEGRWNSQKEKSGDEKNVGLKGCRLRSLLSGREDGGEMGLGGRFARARARARAFRLVGASVALRLWAGREVEWETAELGVGGWAE